jgi:type III restriction enzyme
MKIQFNANLQYQEDAIQSTVDLFRGQTAAEALFSVPVYNAPADDSELDLRSEDARGVANKLHLQKDDILANLRAIQIRNGLKQTEDLKSLDFTVEMETGTGKTYVYLRTIFELHKAYGMRKFIIVVPSVAIREGVYKSLQITSEHFKALYTEVPEHYVYKSEQPGDIRAFATGTNIQIMVINIDAFRKGFDAKTGAAETAEDSKKATLIHRPSEKLNGLKPIEFIRQTNPVLIIDEPQNMETANAKGALASMNPLFTLRYSATHKDRYNPIYKLDSIDAYEQKLVKQIEVAEIKDHEAHNTPHIKLLKVSKPSAKAITAEIEFDQRDAKGFVTRTKKKIKSGDDIEELSKGREIYNGFQVSEINRREGDEFVSFEPAGIRLQVGETHGGMADDDLKRLQIRKTIEEHLDKELVLTAQGIKVLSLFFIDKVANYRSYDDDGNPLKGKYALWFEEEYAELIQREKYKTLFTDVDTESLPGIVHNGYFAQDNKKKFKDSTTGNSEADSDAYSLIMKDKERLLSFDSKLKFIFSHSALREGWDNPNVFQICTLNETASVLKKRQEIGRGLRLAVNQDGERIQGFEVNTLTVMANEAYDSFVRRLQKEMEEDEDLHFGTVLEHQFANITRTNLDGTTSYLGEQESKNLFDQLKKEGHIDNKGKVQDSLRLALKEKTLELSEKQKPLKEAFYANLKRVAGNLNVKSKEERMKVELNKRVFLDPAFKELWDQIKYKTRYRLDFDSKKLIEACVKKLNKELDIGAPVIIYTKDKVEVKRSGLSGGKPITEVEVFDKRNYKLPDIVGYLTETTMLKRQSVIDILINSKKLEDFPKNPQHFIERASEIIKQEMEFFIVDGITYHKIDEGGSEAIYTQELFQNEELHGYFRKNILKVKNSVFNHVVYDSDIEKTFAEKMERSNNVKLYAKLPDWFKIPTPLGNYNPDWAILVTVGDEDRIYFVVETKSSLLSADRREKENQKIQCGKAHFRDIQTENKFKVTNDFTELSTHFVKA